MRCCEYSSMMPTSATTNRTAARIAKKTLVESDRSMLSLRSLEPFVEHRERRDTMHQPAGNPHDQPGEPLVVDRVEADAGHPHRRVIGVPRARRQAHQRTERSADERR